MSLKKMACFLFVFLVFLFASFCFEEALYASNLPFEIGTGIADITGPPAEVQFGGYVDFEQLGKGLYMRQFARSFIIKTNDNNPNSSRRIVLVEADLPMQSAGVFAAVIRKLKEKYGGLYSEKNVNLGATHTHSGPGGYFKTFMTNAMVGMTFHGDYFNTIVNGILESITMAHNNLAPGRLYLNSGEFNADKNISNEFSPNTRACRNRSPEAYYLNHDIENYLLPEGTLNPDNGSRYDDTNRELTQLQFVRNGSAIGIYNWTPVHPHMSGPHKFLIHGDIMGLTSYLFEKKQGTNYSDNLNFIAGFAMNDCGDMSGNLPDDRLLFDDISNSNENWGADGSHDYERLEFRAKSVYALANSLLESGGSELTGSIEYRQMFVPVQNFPINPQFINEDQIYYANELGEDINSCKTCMGAIGLGMFAGPSEDGGGFLDSEGHAREDVTDYSLPSVADLVDEPLPSIMELLQATLVPGDELHDEMDCELEKIMAAGFQEIDAVLPNAKAYNVIFPVSILKIGSLAVLTLPLEVSTMAGRRLKAEIRSALPGVTHIVINANSNAYDSYLVTREEYASQQYEGGSNLFGPYTLNAIRQWTNDLALSFSPGVDLPYYAVDIETFEEGLEETPLVPQVLGHVLLDDKPLLTDFGDVLTQPNASYANGQTASAVFWGAHPNNNLAVGSHESYLVIEKKTDTGQQQCREERVGCDTVSICETVYSWEQAASDIDPSTRYIWKREGASYSHITIEWHIPNDAAAGEYRIRHIGQWKSGWTGAVSRYEGVSETFFVE